MAVVQISKIQVRRGLQEDLSTLTGNTTLASGELGWSIDARRLFIGNGTFAEGAPTQGITEVLTQYSGVSQSGNIALLQSNVANLQSVVTSLVSNAALYSTTLLDNTTASVMNGNTTITLNSLSSTAISYDIIRGTTARVGTMKATQLAGTATFEDDYVETASTGVTLSWVTSENISILTYTTTSTGTAATLNYYIKPFK